MGEFFEMHFNQLYCTIIFPEKYVSKNVFGKKTIYKQENAFAQTHNKGFFIIL